MAKPPLEKIAPNAYGKQQWLLNYRQKLSCKAQGTDSLNTAELLHIQKKLLGLTNKL